MDSFIGYLTDPPSGVESYESMMMVMHEVNDMCTPLGKHAILTAEDRHGVVIDPENELHLEVRATKLRTLYPKTFDLAQDIWVTSKFKNIYSLRGGGPRRRVRWTMR